jgi:hypothetical protein
MLSNTLRDELKLERRRRSLPAADGMMMDVRKYDCV